MAVVFVAQRIPIPFDAPATPFTYPNRMMLRIVELGRRLGNLQLAIRVQTTIA